MSVRDQQTLGLLCSQPPPHTAPCATAARRAGLEWAERGQHGGEAQLLLGLRFISSVKQAPSEEGNVQYQCLHWHKLEVAPEIQWIPMGSLWFTPAGSSVSHRMMQKGVTT